MTMRKRANICVSVGGHVDSFQPRPGPVHQSAPAAAGRLQPKPWLQAEAWPDCPGLVHGFSQRLPSGLDKASIVAALGGQPSLLQTLKQVHGNTIVRIGRGSRTKELEADGMLTTEQNVLLGIKTADCVPVLLVAPQRRGVSALHAGWRGTQAAISLRAVALCTEHWAVAPSQLWAALGPSIDGCCYQVGSEIGEPLFERWGDGHSTTWKRQGDRGYLDLRAINRMQLIQAGVPNTQIQRVGACTFCHPDEFTSYRREGSHAGRQLSVIGWQRHCRNV